jgi:lysophospholipase L1-like esterase
MRRRLALLLAAMLAMGVVTAVPVAADDHSGDGGTYLALGDSVAAGTQQPIGFTDGYTKLLFDKLEKKYGFDNFVNLACPGDDTVEMRDGNDTTATEIGSLCYGVATFVDPFGFDYRIRPADVDSQLDAAVDFLLEHGEEVKLITLTIGANDVLACDPFTLTDDELNACVAAQLGQIAANLPDIVGTLQAYSDAPIVAMNYYNPNLAFWITGPEGQELANASNVLTTLFNGTLEAVYGNELFNVPVVDVAEAFKTFETKGKTPKNVKEICKLTLMCEKSDGAYVLVDWNPVAPGVQADIHPSNKGYHKIAKAFEKLIKKQHLLDG